MNRCRWLGATLATLLLTLGDVHAVSAQHLRGRLLDLESKEPLPAGLVTLLAADGTTLVTAVTDRDGYWHLKVPGAGSYYVAAKRLGYHPWMDGLVEVRASDDLNSVFHLRRLPLTLDPIEVSAQATQRYLELMGFYNRQRSDFGHYITPQDIDKRQATRITDLVAGLPGVHIAPITPGSVGSLYVQLRGGTIVDGASCRPRVFVDGIIYAHGDSRLKRPAPNEQATERRPDDEVRRLEQGLSLDDIGHPSTIAAIEVYRSASQVPVQFGGASVETLCGVIVIWTRSGNTRAAR